MSDIAAEIIRKQESLANDRSVFENHWAEVAPFVLPRQDEFFNQLAQKGEKRSWNRYDDTAILALDRFAAAMESILTPRSSKWHSLTVDEELREDKEVQEWLDKLTDMLFRMRYSTSANYASQQHECYMSLGAFGTSVLILEDVVGKGMRYKSSHLGEHYFMEDLHGKINHNYRRYRLSALQAAEKFGQETLPEAMQKALEKEPYTKFEFIHCVMPNEEGGDYAFNSFHVAIDSKKLMADGGFKTFPYIISRYVTSPNETYGRSPAMSSLAEIKMLNSMRKTDIKARHLAVDPPNLAADQSTIRKFANRPGAMNYGALDSAGNQLVKPYQSAARIDVSNDGIQQSREFINDTFLVTLFQILVETPAMTATEVLQRAQEKGALLSPTAGRQQSESQGPMIEREISILEEYGIFEDDGVLPMPQALKERDGNFEIEYTSPLSRMQKSEDALATERTIQSLVPLAQINPDILDRVDWKEYGNIMLEANGAPSKLFKSDEEMAALEEQKAEQQQTQQMIEAAPQVAGAVKDIAHAQSMSEG